jgi:hypothetical protein
MHLAQGTNPIVQMVEHKRHQRRVEALILKPVKRRPEIVHADVEALTCSPSGESNHGRAVIEANDLSAEGEQRLGVEAWPASRVEYALSADSAEQPEHGRAVIEGVVSAVGSVTLVFAGKRVEERRALGGVHALISIPPTTPCRADSRAHLAARAVLINRPAMQVDNHAL